MMFKRIYIVVLLVTSSFLMRGQQVPMYNHYFFNSLVYNPAFAGNSEDIRASLISRMQWSGFRNAPQINIFTADGAIQENKAGLGLLVMSDRRGINRRTSGIVSYAYHARLGEDAVLSFGLGLGVVNHSISFLDAVAENYADPTLFSPNLQKTVLDGNAGLAFHWKGLELAASAPQLFGNGISFRNDTATGFTYLHARHYMSSLKYRITLSEEKNISLAPQVLLRIVPGAPMQFDGNLNFDWNNKFWLGATYKSAYAVSVNAGIYLHKRFCVGYSYEFMTGSIGTYAGMSHELLLSFRFGKGPKEKPAEEPVIDNNASQASNQRVDSLQEELGQSKEEIKELRKKLAQQGQAQEQTQAQIKALEESVKNANAQIAASQNSSQSSSTSSTNESNGSQSTGGNQSSGSLGNNKQNNSGGKPNTKGGGAVKGQNNSASQNTSVKTNNGGATSDYKSPSHLDMLTSKVMDSDVWLATYPASEYVDESNQKPSTGYYVIVGTFFYRDLAEAEAGRFRKRGYKGCKWIFSEVTKHNYIFTHRLNSKEEAIGKTKDAWAAGTRDAWILELK